LVSNTGMDDQDCAWRRDHALAQRALGGDAAAFAEIVVNHQKQVWHIAWRMLQHRQEAEDCAQEVFLRVHRSLGQYRGESTLGTWIGRVAFTVALRMARKRNLRVDLPGDEEPDAVFERIGSSEDIVQAKADADQLAILHAAMEQLPSLPRTVLGLHYFDGLTVAEIAELLDCPEGTVKSHLNRGRNRLKAALINQESTYAHV
jgi:RNA polymerase sigma factor (sigma-70 family)